MNKLWSALLVGLAATLIVRAESPLPAVEEVLRRVVARAAQEKDNDRSFAARYQFVKTKVTQYRNAQGELQKQETKASTNTPAAVRAITPAVAARPATSEQPISATHSNIKNKGFDKKEMLANPELLDRFDFKVVGRETTNGRAVLVLDFLPKNKKLPEQNFKDAFINKAAGRVWVDEAEAVVTKADLHLAERVNVFGGIAGAVWKFTYGFDRERTPEGLWYVRAVNWHIEGREVIINRIVDFHESKTQLRKVESLAQR